METIQSLRPNMSLSFDPKINRGPSQVEVYICEVSLLYAKTKWSCGAETVKKFKVQI